MFAFNLIYLISHFHSFSADRRGAELSFKIHFRICMVKTRMYTTSHVGEKLQISYEDQGVKHQVLHDLPDRPAAGAQQWHSFRNMSRKQRHKHITVLL